MLQPLLATPAEKSWMEEVSWAPVSLRSLSLPGESRREKVMLNIYITVNCVLARILRISSPSLGSYALMCLTWCRESLSMAASMACTTQCNRMIREMLTKLEVCNICKNHLHELLWSPWCPPWPSWALWRSWCELQLHSSHRPSAWGRKTPRHRSPPPPSKKYFCFLLSYFLGRQTWRRYLLTQRSSPMSIPSVGPTWYSHWAGITSALVPETLDESVEIGNV